MGEDAWDPEEVGTGIREGCHRRCRAVGETLGEQRREDLQISHLLLWKAWPVG